MKKTKNEHAKFTNTIECQKKTTSHCELLVFYYRCLLLRHLQRGFDLFFFIGHSHSSEEYYSEKVYVPVNFIFASYYERLMGIANL